MSQSSESLRPAPLPTIAQLDLAQLTELLPTINAGHEAAAQRKALIFRFIQDEQWQRNTIAEAAGVSHQYVSKLAKRVGTPTGRKGDAPASHEESASHEASDDEWTIFLLETITGQYGGEAQVESCDMDATDATKVLSLAATQGTTLPATIAARLHQLASTITEATR